MCYNHSMKAEYKSLYRKYRPLDFEEILGQDHITRVLQGAIKDKNISHAYIFAGSRGTGKTSMARIFARALGTENEDIYEIDGASNRRIEDVRELREAVNTSPFSSPYKVYIIDEVHMLTKEAFNALLKTLEEPPAHAIFILATTELNRVPETVISRCQTFVFKKPSRKMLRDMVIDISKKEKKILDTSSADLIALLGDGSFRDTQGILQKVMSAYSNKKISTEEVEKVTGAPDSHFVNGFLSAVNQGNVSEGFACIENVANQSTDMELFLKLILHKARAVILLRFSKNAEKEMAEEFSGEDLLFLKKLAKDKGSNINSSFVRKLLQTHIETKTASIPSLPLELALVEVLGDNAISK